MARASGRRRSISTCSNSFRRTGWRRQWPTCSARRGSVRTASSPGARGKPTHWSPGAPSRRNRLSRRRQGPMAAHRLDRGPDLVSAVGQAGRLAQGLSGWRGRARPFQTRLPMAQGPPRALNAHHLRELKARIDIDKERWARQMRDLLLEASETVRRAIAEGATGLAAPVLRLWIKRYNAIVRRGLALHRKLPPLARQIGPRGRPPHRPGHNLRIRLNKFKATSCASAMTSPSPSPTTGPSGTCA